MVCLISLAAFILGAASDTWVLNFWILDGSRRLTTLLWEAQDFGCKSKRSVARNSASRTSGGLCPFASGVTGHGRMVNLGLGPLCMIVSHTRVVFSLVQFRIRLSNVGLTRWAHLLTRALICQIELYAVVLLRFLAQDMLCNRRVLIFVDTDAARFCLIRGSSKSGTMSRLIEAFDSLDSSCPMGFIGWRGLPLSAT